MHFYRKRREGCPCPCPGPPGLELNVVIAICAALSVSLLLVSYFGISSPSSCANRTRILLSDESTPLRPENATANVAKCAGPRVLNLAAAASGGACEMGWDTPSVTQERKWERLLDGTILRPFTPVGAAAFLFIQFGAYRGGPSNFSIVGLSPTTLQKRGNPGFQCSWIPRTGGEVLGATTTYVPGFHAAHQYSGIVVYCNFETEVGTDGSGGILQVMAEMGSQDRTGLQSVKFTALTELEWEYDASLFKLPLKYDYMFCGPPLYGRISPQRVREWMAYHAWLFGPRSHFVFYDAGGLHDDVRTVLAPWVQRGWVTIVNFRQESRYDSFYHGQYVVVNDCLLQAKRVSEWAFFFDLDEFLFVPANTSLDEVMRELVARGRRAQQVTFDQRPMNNDHCVTRTSDESDDSYRSRWGFEKLVFHRTQITEWGGWKQHKYAVQTKYILTAGVHDHEYSLLPDGMSKKDTINYVSWEDKLHYYHYPGSLSVREDLCKEFVAVDDWAIDFQINNVTHIFDDRMASLADAVRQFELETIGAQPFIL